MLTYVILEFALCNWLCNWVSVFLKIGETKIQGYCTLLWSFTDFEGVGYNITQSIKYKTVSIFQNKWMIFEKRDHLEIGQYQNIKSRKTAP